MTATVNSDATPLTTGQVNFCDASAAYCTDIHLKATAQLTSAGTAVFKFVPGVGHHTYKAVFVGTNSYTKSSSTVSTLTVTSSQIYPSTTTIASSESAGAYTLTATVVGAGSSTSPAPTGIVSFLDTSYGDSVLGTAALAPGTAGHYYINSSNPPAAGAPGQPVVGDFNGDGKADLVLADLAGGTMSILLGNGDGSFTTGSPVTASPSGAYPVAVGDFNGDGKTDLIVANFSTSDGTATGTVTALLGNGDGTFIAAAASMIDAAPGQVAVGDLDHDGNPDLAVLAGTSIAILLGNGDGTFTPAAAISLGDSIVVSTSLTVGDFNGDGKADLVAMGSLPLGPGITLPGLGPVSQIMVLLGKGDGTFTTAPGLSTCCSASSLIGGDFNQDGKTDLVVAQIDGRDRAQASLWLGKGDGTFGEPEFSELNSFDLTSSIAIGDFNGDGDADLAIGGSSASNLLVELGDGAGNFTSDQSQPTANAAYLALGDFDGSGTTDLALTGVNKSAVTIYLTQPTQSATATIKDVSPVGQGTHQVKASYPGDGTYSGSVSTPVGLTSFIAFSVPDHTYGDPPFTVAATSISTGAFTYSLVSGPATLTGSTVTVAEPGSVMLQVSQAAADGYPKTTQTASFAIHPAILSVTTNNSARVFGTANPTFTGTLMGAVHGDTFSETFSTPATAASIVGTYPVSASITGPNLANYTISSTSGTLTIAPAGTATTFALSNQNTTLTATVASLTSGLPTGTVAFYEGQTQVGTGSLTNGIASYTSSTLPAGDVVFSAQYSGDANFTPSGSAPIPLLSISPDTASLTVASAGSVTDNVSLSSAPGYGGTVQLSCSGLPTNATCSFQPSSVTFSASNTAAKVSMTIQTGVASQARLQSPPPAGDEGPSGILFGVIWVPGIFTGIALGRGRKASRSRLNQMLMLLLLLGGLCTGVGACGSGSTSTTHPSSTSTPAGTYAVQLITSAGSGMSNTVAVTLSVQ